MPTSQACAPQAASLSPASTAREGTVPSDIHVPSPPSQACAPQAASPSPALTAWEGTVPSDIHVPSPMPTSQACAPQAASPSPASTAREGTVHSASGSIVYTTEKLSMGPFKTMHEDEELARFALGEVACSCYDLVTTAVESGDEAGLGAKFYGEYCRVHRIYRINRAIGSDAKLQKKLPLAFTPVPFFTPKNDGNEFIRRGSKLVAPFAFKPLTPDDLFLLANICGDDVCLIGQRHGDLVATFSGQPH
eukprot:gene22040-29104_t